MKKTFFSLAAIAAMLLAGLTSCNDDVYNDSQLSFDKANVIGFNITQDGSLATRGTATTSSNYLTQINNFQIVSFYNDGSGRYVGTKDNEGTTIDGDGKGSWSYHTATDVQYWPAKTLDFQAVTPASDASFTLSNTPSSGSSRLTANVTVPTTVANQKDIMFASATNVNNAASGDAVDLTFKHALSQVVFSAKLASTKITAVVSELEACHVYGAGNVGYRDALTTVSASATGEAKSKFQAGLMTKEADRTITSTTDAKNLSAENGALLMVPQERVAWTHAAPEKAISDATGAYLRIKCKVTDNTSSTVLINDENIYLPFDLSTDNNRNWEVGKKYTYMIVFGNGVGGYDANGDALTNLVPVTYTVSTADDWVATDAIVANGSN